MTIYIYIYIYSLGPRLDLFRFPDYFLKTEKKENKVKPEDNGERECESWREVADSRSESRRTVFYTLTTSYLRHEPVPYKLKTRNAL